MWPKDSPPKPETIRALRTQRGWTPDDLADRLGMHGSGSIVSDWEEGRRAFEGPIANLLLLTLRSGGSDAIHERAEDIWRRSLTWRESWRQVSAIPTVPARIEPAAFASLFPSAEIPPAQHAHGFPFLDHGLPREVFRLAERGWVGVIPASEHPPAYLWMLERDGSFLYREKIWEDAKASITGGHIHIGSLLEICAATVFFLRRLAEHVPSSGRYRIGLALGGMQGRGVVAQREGTPSDMLAFDEPVQISAESNCSASILAELEAIASSPLAVVFELVAATVRGLRPDLADHAQLDRQLRLRHAFDDRRGRIRFLGFLDDLLGRPPRRMIVSLHGRRVGLLVETSSGSRFTYDRRYIDDPEARPVSPTMPVRQEPYESAGLLPFFDNLLPEGAQLDILVRRHKLDPRDKFGILLATLPSAIGAVEIHQEERIETP
jgi:serine/threonine-protein kinase HipA